MPGPRLTPEQVVEYRLRYRSGETLTALSAEIQMSRNNVTNMLTGRTYARVLDHKIPLDHIRNEMGRVLPPEVVLFMRLIYTNCPGASSLKLARAYGVHQKTVLSMLTGRTYSEVPEAIEQLRPPGKEKRLTDEQVLYCRRMYRTRQIPVQALAREFGIKKSPMFQIIRGLSYKHLPGAVPDHIRWQRRGHSIAKRRPTDSDPNPPVESTADSVSA